MDQATALDHVRQYSDVVRRYFDVRSIILFGSYAKGNAREESDIDVAVVLDELKEDWLTSSAKLCKLTRAIDVGIEPVILDPNHDESGFLEHVLETGIVIYNRGD